MPMPLIDFVAYRSVAFWCAPSVFLKFLSDHTDYIVAFLLF